MEKEKVGDRTELTPRDLFLAAFEEATQHIAGALADAGLDEDSIWSAYREAIGIVHRSTESVEREAKWAKIAALRVAVEAA